MADSSPHPYLRPLAFVEANERGVISKNRPAADRTGRVLFMDGGRGLAALLVLEHHTMVYFGERASEILGAGAFTLQLLQFLSSLNVAAVQFFFFLSGWAIYLSLDHARAADGNIVWRVFAWHRCRRILPLYWLALLLSWALFTPLNAPAGSASLTNLAGNFVFLQTPAVSGGWFTPYAANGPLWSLSFEAWYYAATPLVCLPIFWKSSSKSLRLLSLMTASLAVAFVALPITKLCFFPLATYAVLWPIWVAGFAFGAASKKGDAETAILVFAASSGAAVYMAHKLTGSGTLGVLADGFFIVSLAILTVMAATHFNGASTFASAIERRLTALFVFLGSGSYALYVFHYPVLRWLATHQVSNLGLLLTLAAMIATMPLLEQRLLQFVKRLSYAQIPAAA